MGFENNVYGSIHPENTYNLENEDRDRQNIQKENREKSSNGHQPYVSIEDVPDENAEKDVYGAEDENIYENKNTFEFDKFGFVQVLQDYFDKVGDDKKEELFRNTNEFLVEYRRILDNAKDEKTALKEAENAFYKIIGEQVSGYDTETGKISFDVEKAKFIKVRDKSAPSDAIKVEYDKYGKPVDPDETPAIKKIKEVNTMRTKHAKPGLKMPWRR